jgi:hypothetical protein
MKLANGMLHRGCVLVKEGVYKIDKFLLGDVESGEPDREQGGASGNSSHSIENIENIENVLNKQFDAALFQFL